MPLLKQNANYNEWRESTHRIDAAASQALSQCPRSI
jgi:hypothetical protein